MPIKTVTISPEVAEVLSRCSVADNIVRLPEGEQLPRPLYDATDKVLRALGGKWNRSARAHVFTDGIGDQLGQALAAGHVVDTKKSLEQFFTPPDLAAEVAELAELRPYLTVLEPSAGGGALVRLAVDAGCYVDAFEIDPQLCAALQDIPGICAVRGDFMTVRRPAIGYDRILMNPPFSGNQDARHVLHAFDFLKPGGKLVSIISEHSFIASDRVSRAFQEWLREQRAGVIRVPAGAFKQSGTMVGARIVIVDKRER